MPFLPPRSPMPAGRSARSTGPLLSVGRRVFVNCPRDRSARVVLTDDTGRTGSQGLADGAEVEIVAWRPRGAGGVRYRVHSMRDGLEGWLAADDLRATAAPAPAPGKQPTSDAARPEPRDAGRKFGQRAGIER
jgi:hypothetical protein